MDQKTLAEAANISLPTLRRMEASDGSASGLKNNVLAVRSALEQAGVIFIASNGDGPGVRLRKARLSDPLPHQPVEGEAGIIDTNEM